MECLCPSEYLKCGYTKIIVDLENPLGLKVASFQEFEKTRCDESSEVLFILAVKGIQFSLTRISKFSVSHTVPQKRLSFRRDACIQMLVTHFCLQHIEAAPVA